MTDRPPASGELPDFDSWEDMIENQHMIPDPPASGEPARYNLSGLFDDNGRPATPASGEPNTAIDQQVFADLWEIVSRYDRPAVRRIVTDAILRDREARATPPSLAFTVDDVAAALYDDRCVPPPQTEHAQHVYDALAARLTSKEER